MDRITILVVEDEQVSFLRIERAVSQSGKDAEVVRAETFQEGLEQAHAAGIVIVDLVLPDKDIGEDIDALDAFADVPCLACTASESEELAEKIGEQKGIGFMPKNMPMQSLVCTLVNQIGQSRRAKKIQEEARRLEQDYQALLGGESE